MWNAQRAAPKQTKYVVFIFCVLRVRNVPDTLFHSSHRITHTYILIRIVCEPKQKKKKTTKITLHHTRQRRRPIQSVVATFRLIQINASQRSVMFSYNVVSKYVVITVLAVKHGHIRCLENKQSLFVVQNSKKQTKCPWPSSHIASYPIKISF